MALLRTAFSRPFQPANFLMLLDNFRLAPMLLKIIYLRRGCEAELDKRGLPIDQGKRAGSPYG
jgi:hypothetical protein